MSDITGSTPPAPREPGEDGTTTSAGDIQTPMCSTNVGRKGTPGTHSYANTMNLGSNGEVSITGPGAKGMWDTQIKINGSNQKKY